MLRQTGHSIGGRVDRVMIVRKPKASDGRAMTIHVERHSNRQIYILERHFDRLSVEAQESLLVGPIEWTSWTSPAYLCMLMDGRSLSVPSRLSPTGSAIGSQMQHTAFSVTETYLAVFVSSRIILASMLRNNR